MNKKVLKATFAVAIALMGGINVFNALKTETLSDIALANVEALASNESGGGQSYGCGYAAYELDDDWYEDTKKVTKCGKGCPETEGTEPKYIWC